MITRIDAHHHVWDLSVRDQPWMAGETMAPIARSFGIDEFMSEADANGISASVVVQTVTNVAETEELLDLAADVQRLAGVVGWIDLATADVGDQLDQLQARPSGRWLVGIRSLVQYEPDPAWLMRPSVLSGLREVARRGLVNELLVLPHQLPAVLSAVREITESPFVLDHLAKPAIAAGHWDPWATDLAAIAAMPQRRRQDLRSGDRSRLVALDVGRHPTVHRSCSLNLRSRSTRVRQRLAGVHACGDVRADHRIGRRSALRSVRWRARSDLRRKRGSDLHTRSTTSGGVMSHDLTGLRFIVTGGASGIGRAVTTAALNAGATVTVLDLDPANAPIGAICRRADIADDVSVADAVAQSAEAMGGIDIVINNAGIGAQGTVETNSLDEWRHVFEVNVFGMVRVDPRRASTPAPFRARCCRQHLLYRCHCGTTRPGRLQREQGCGVVADVGNGSRSPPRRHPRELCESRYCRHTVGCEAPRSRR